MARAKKYMVANWKMNPETLSEAETLFSGIKSAASRLRRTETVICPPFVYVDALVQLYSGKKILFGAQDVFWEKSGSFTGEVSAGMLKDVGAGFVIIGHSERRALGEDDESVNKKILAVLREEMKPILCVGERERDRHGTYLSFIQDELNKAFEGVPEAMLKHFIIAYEPIWAIGKTAAEAMKPEDVHEISLFIKKVLAEKYNKELALNVPILYGGSVELSNIKELLNTGAVDGFLVGHASLDSEQFSEMLKVVD